MVRCFFGYPSTTRCSAARSVQWTNPEGQTGPRKFTCRSTPTAPAELGGAMARSPPTRAKSPHAAEGPRLPNPGNGRSTPYHDARRPQTWWLRHDDRGLSSGNPVLPGSIWVSPEGPRTEGTAGPYPPGAGKLQGRFSYSNTVTQ